MTAAIPFWLPLPFLAYALGCLYFARMAFGENSNHDQYFSAGHSLTPWISALLIAGAGLSGWFLLAATSQIASGGFSMAVLLIGGTALALPGVVLFKRVWLVGQRLGVSSEAELLRRYYASNFLVAASAVVAVVMAIGFCGLQLRAMSELTATLTSGAVSTPVGATLLGALVFAYVAIGGMRAIGYIGAIQSVLLVAATIVLTGIVLIAFGGFGPLNAALKTLAADPAQQSKFLVAGVIRFTAGIGRDEVGFVPSAMANFGLFLALMGIQTSPLVLKIVLSTRSPSGIAAGQTWVLAGVFGGIIAFGVGTLGAGALLNPALTVPAILTNMVSSSPWFAGWLFVGLLAGVQLLAGLGLLVTSETLVRHLYRPLLHSDIDRHNTVNLARICAAVLMTITVLLAILAPVTLSALGGVALPLSLQLAVPLVGIVWIGRVTREAAVVGVSAGFVAVLLTEPLGHSVLSFLGLELPWGRWPWTLHSAILGLAANLAATLLVAVATRLRPATEEATDVRRFLSSTPSMERSGLRSTAWAAVLAWFFLAAGPGLLFGNYAFGAPGAEDAFLLGVPSLWAWSGLFWALGLGLVWFLSYRMGLAVGFPDHVEQRQTTPRLRKPQGEAERQRLQRLVAAAAIIFGLTVLTVFSFGR
ncbi:MAG: hypothetical protein QM744_00700 [Mesorhizobium sp.]